MTTGLKMLLLLVLLTSAFAAFLFALSGGAAASVATEAVSIDDPDLDYIETDVSFNGTETAYVVVTDINDNEVSNQSISGTAGETITTETWVSEAGDYSVIVSEANETSVDGLQVNATSTEVRSYSELAQESFEITDIENESIVGDVTFLEDASAELVIVDDDTNTTVDTVTISGTSSDTLTRSTNVTANGNYTATIRTLDNTSAFGDVYVSLDDGTDSGGILGGTTSDSQDMMVIAGLLILLVVAGYKYGENYP